MAAASVQLGAIVIIAKLLTNTALPVPFLLAFRFVMAALVMAAVLVWRHEPLLAAHRERLALIGIGTLGYGLAALLFFLSLRYGPTSTLALIVYSYPIFVVIASLLLGQGLPARLVVAAVVVGFCGVAFIVWTPGGVALRPLGVLLALLAARAFFRFQRRDTGAVPAEIDLLHEKAEVIVPLDDETMGKVRVSVGMSVSDVYALAAERGRHYERGDVVQIVQVADDCVHVR